MLSKEELSLLLQHANIHAEKKNVLGHLIILELLWSIKRHIFIICYHIHFYANEKPIPDENLFSDSQMEVSGNHILFVFEVCL